MTEKKKSNGNDKQKAQVEKKRQKVIEKYIALVEKLNRFPTQPELLATGVDYSSFCRWFRNMATLNKEAKEAFPNAFSGLFSSEDFTFARFKNTKEALKDVDSFIVTTVVAGCEAHEPALAAIKSWEKDTGGMLLCQPIKDPAQTLSSGKSNMNLDFFDPILGSYDFIWKKLKLNNSVTLSDISVSAKQLNPHTGLERISNNAGLTIVASPKRRLTPLANMSGQPGYLISAGAITLPNYETDKYMSLRTAEFGYAEHKLGGVYVKLLGKNRYEFTPITFDKTDGHFSIGLKTYSDSGVVETLPQILSFGDLHVEELTEWRTNAFFEILETAPSTEIDLHDVFSGISCNPFNKKKPELQYLEGRASRSTTVEEDLKRVGTFLNDAAQFSKVNVIDSNHHKFLEYWITSGAYRVGDPANIKFAHKLAEAWLSNPRTPILLTALRCAGVDLNSKVIFHGSIKSLKFKGIERSQHGHLSSTGKPRVLGKLMEELGPCNVAHTHVVQIIGEAWNPGTFSGVGERRPEYACKGPNKQGNAYIRVYPDGQRELVHIFEPSGREN